MALRGRHLVPVLSAAFLLASPLPAAAASPGKILPDPDGSGAVILRANGAMEHVDRATGEVRGVRAAGGPHPVAIARPGKGSIVYAIVPREDGRTTALEAHDTGGETGPSLEVKGRGYLLEVTEDGRFACIAGTKAGSKDAAADRWILTVVDIATGEVAPPISLGFVPTAMALRVLDGILARLFIAGDDRVATYTMVPPRPSWFYRSPGAHHDIALPAASAVVCLLRDATFAVIDPDRWERDEGRVRATTDDATAVVDLSFTGASIAMAPDGRFAAVLAQDGLTISLIDVAAGRIERTIALDGPQDLAARLMASDDGVAARLPASRASQGAPLIWVEVPLPERSEPVEMAAAAETRAPAQTESVPEEQAGPAAAGAARDMTASPPQAFPTAAQIESLPAPPSRTAAPIQEPPAPTPTGNAPPKASTPEPKAAPVTEPAGASAPSANRPADQPVEAAQPPPASPAPEQPAGTPPTGTAEAATEPAPAPSGSEPEPVAPPPPGAAPPAPAPDRVLSGHVRGEIPAGLEVLLYGPDNVLRLSVRTPVAMDGQWRVPLPPAGRYRVVVSAGSARHVFVSPEFRTIVITGSGEAMADIDFEIRGSL